MLSCFGEPTSEQGNEDGRWGMLKSLSARLNIAISFPGADYYGHPRSTRKHENRFFDDMHSFIAAMAKRFAIDLAITVGHPAMIGTGPAGRSCC